MRLFSILTFVAAGCALLLAVGSVLRKKPTISAWCFCAGMTILAVDSVLTGLNSLDAPWIDVLDVLTVGLIVKAFVPLPWLIFSLTYSRGDYRDSLKRWRIPLMAFSVSAIGVALGFQQQLFGFVLAGPQEDVLQIRAGIAAKIVNGLLLVGHVWILMNLEQTFRSAVGTMRWRIKFVVLGLAVIFAARIYVRSQALLFSAYDTQATGVESSALLIGSLFLIVAYARTGFAEIDVYPSRAVLGSSLTVILVGGYLFIVGILANVIRQVGGSESFQFQAFVVLLGMAGLGTLLLSDRLRQRLRGFVGRHFKRAQHDSVRIWTEFSRRLAHVRDQAGLCAASSRLISETFEVLSVTVWLLDEQKDQFVLCASTTAQSGEATAVNTSAATSSAVIAGVATKSSPFDLESVADPWGGELRDLNPTAFPNGGNRSCVPLRTGERCLGVLVLADRVNGAIYTPEESHLLQCIADQVTSVLLNLRLANEVARSRELEAFRTMSAFFVHDLKNAASSLNLMLRNLPVHFDDPAFREDALRGIGNTARRIDEMIGRLTALRQQARLQPVESDLNQLVSEALDRVDKNPDVEQLTKELQPLPRIPADREQIQSVVANLVLNARDAIAPGGHIHLRTEQLGDNVVLTVTDDGCGMSPAFVKDSLFRPFRSTKKKGLGIGMFQSRMIVEAHGGSIRVESEAGKGSTFRVSLPVREGK